MRGKIMQFDEAFQNEIVRVDASSRRRWGDRLTMFLTARISSR